MWPAELITRSERYNMINSVMHHMSIPQITHRSSHGDMGQAMIKGT